jgi:hypothetical protein
MDLTAEDSAEKWRNLRKALPPILIGDSCALALALIALGVRHFLPTTSYATPSIMVFGLAVKLMNRKRSGILHYAAGATGFIAMVFWATSTVRGMMVTALCIFLFVAVDSVLDEYLKRAARAR